MNQDSLVSIIVPNFNRSFYLKEALDSIRAQSYGHWECIVVDDGSVDDSLALVASLSRDDNRIRAIKNRGKGAAAARNWGVQQANGKYVIFLDSDDLLLPFCLEKRVEVMESEGELDFVVFPMLLFYQRPGDTDLLWNIETDEEDVIRFLKLDAVWQTTGPVWRREALWRFPLFDERLTCWQDVSFHINVLLEVPKYKKYYKLPPDAYYRKGSSDSISQQRINSPTHLHSRSLLIKQLEERLKVSKRFTAKIIFLNYYFSYLNSGKITDIPIFLYLFKKNYKPENKELMQVISLSFLKGLRLTKIVYLQKLYTSEISRILPESSIGKHNYVV